MEYCGMSHEIRLLHGFMDFLSFNNLFTVLMGNSLAAYNLWTLLMIEFLSIV